MTTIYRPIARDGRRARIVAGRERLGLTADEAGEKACMDPGRWAEIEAGAEVTSYPEFIHIARTLCVPLTTLTHDSTVVDRVQISVHGREPRSAAEAAAIADVQAHLMWLMELDEWREIGVGQHSAAD